MKQQTKKLNHENILNNMHSGHPFIKAKKEPYQCSAMPNVAK